MRQSNVLSATSAALLGLLALSGPALAWVPKLEDTTAKNVIDGVYARRDPVATFLTIDLNVKNGAFVTGQGAVAAFAGGDRCVSDWLAAPQDAALGSRPLTVTLSGQADELAFQAQEARNTFQNLSVEDALGADLTAARLPDGELRVDIAVSGLPTLQSRAAYLVRLRGPDGKLVAPTRSSYVNDWKPVASAPVTTAPVATAPAEAAPADTATTTTDSTDTGTTDTGTTDTGTTDAGTTATTDTTSTADAAATEPITEPVTEQTTPATTDTTAMPAATTDVSTATAAATAPAPQGPYAGTLVYYFQPLKAGIGASDKTELLLRTEADTNCAYSIPLDLATFQ